MWSPLECFRVILSKFISTLKLNQRRFISHLALAFFRTLKTAEPTTSHGVWQCEWKVDSRLFHDYCVYILRQWSVRRCVGSICMERDDASTGATKTETLHVLSWRRVWKNVCFKGQWHKIFGLFFHELTPHGLLTLSLTAHLMLLISLQSYELPPPPSLKGGYCWKLRWFWWRQGSVCDPFILTV